MKAVMKLMLVWVISFSLVIPVGPVWADAGRVNIEVEVGNAALRRDAKRFAEEQKRAQEHAQADITLTRNKLAAHLDDVRNGIVFNGLIGDFFKSLENEDDKYRAIYPRLKVKIELITGLSSRLKSLSESYERTYGQDNDYSWTEFQEDLELDADGKPIIKVNYQGKDLELDLSTFSNVQEENEADEAAPKGRVEKAEASEDERGSDSWSRVFGRADDDDDDEDDRPRKARESERTERTEFSGGCPLPEHDSRPSSPSSGERIFGLGALTLFGIGAGVLAGINTSYLHKEKKSLRHQMERASANGDSPFLYHGAYAALNYQNPLGGLGETLGPISMAISSILMPGNQGYLSQMEYLRNQRMRSIIDAMARARATASTSATASRTVTFEKQLQSLESGLGGIISQLNDGAGGLNDTIRNLAEQTRNEQIAMNRAAQLMTNAGQVFNARSATLSGLSELADRLLKGTQEFNEAVRNGDQNLRQGGADKLTTQFTDNFTSNSSFSGSGNRSGVSTGPNGFFGAPGFPQTGGGGFDARFRFGPR